MLFASGTTEANNLDLKGVADWVKMGHVITARTERKAVLDVCKTPKDIVFRIIYIKVDRAGRIDLNAFDQAITGDTVLCWSR